MQVLFVNIPEIVSLSEIQYSHGSIFFVSVAVCFRLADFCRHVDLSASAIVMAVFDSPFLFSVLFGIHMNPFLLIFTPTPFARRGDIRLLKYKTQIYFRLVLAK